jgi:exodeoxyribonuclease V alpha subunit
VSVVEAHLVQTSTDDRGSQLLPLRAPWPLRAFSESGVLSAADVHVATLLGRLSGTTDPDVLLAAALAVRAPRLGHVFVDLESVAGTAVVESADEPDPGALPWPEPAAWITRVAACEPLVAIGEADTVPTVARPLRLLGAHLYLDRYWREERQVASDLLALGSSPLRRADVPLLAGGIARLFAGADDPDQRVAVASAVLRALAVIAGGPGTGKTTTVAKVIALLAEQAHAIGARPPLVALCAPTGKASARLEQSVHDEAARLDLAPGVREALLALRATTIHRLLGWRPRGGSRFRHDRGNRLPHDLVIVDEMSMVSLTLMARLLEAVRTDSQLLLIGDVEQLTAIEAGAVLRDVVGPAARRPRMSAGTRAAVVRAVGCEVDVTPVDVSGAFGDGIVSLSGEHRFGATIARVAGAIREGDADAVISSLSGGGPDVEWLRELPPATGGALRQAAVEAALLTVRAARAGDGAAALAGLSSFRLLCAHRQGPSGVSTWTAEIERWLADSIPGLDPTARAYAGKPLLITRNDYELRLYNGDTGVVVQTTPDSLSAVFEREGKLVAIAPSRLEAQQTAHAITIHKSQGSQFTVAAVLLGEAGSRILSRELLYTAVTRARRRLILVASEEAVRAAVARPVARATGLGERLWGADLPGGQSAGSGTIQM